MDAPLYALSWLVGLSLFVSALTESQLAVRPGSSKNTSPLPRRVQINKIPPKIRPVPGTPPPTDNATRHASVNRGVTVRCHADSMEVVVQADLYDTGIFIEAEHLHLGSSDCTAFPSEEARLTIHVNLMDCGTKLSSTEETLVYSNVLTYSPRPSKDGLLRLEGVSIPVECHYNKRNSVDGLALQPDWIPFASAAAAEDQLEFKLTLMTDDWQLERESRTYFLGNPINVEASVIIGDHMPLRVYVDRCVATVTPDADAALRYDFIVRHGCLADAYLTNSGSQYLPRVREDKLRFQLDAFMFYQDATNVIYISCQLKAVPATLAVCSQNRACSYIHHRWQSVDGNHPACSTCNDDPHFEDALADEALHPFPAPQGIAEHEPPAAKQAGGAHHAEAKPAPTNFFHFRPRNHLVPSSSSVPTKRTADFKDEWTGNVSSGPLKMLPSIVPPEQANVHYYSAVPSNPGEY